MTHSGSSLAIKHTVLKTPGLLAVLRCMVVATLICVSDCMCKPHLFAQEVHTTPVLSQLLNHHFNPHLCSGRDWEGQRSPQTAASREQCSPCCCSVSPGRARTSTSAGATSVDPECGATGSGGNGNERAPSCRTLTPPCHPLPRVSGTAEGGVHGRGADRWLSYHCGCKSVQYNDSNSASTQKEEGMQNMS